MSWPATLAIGPVLAPAGHPAVDQSRVPGQDRLRSQAQPLHDARTEPLDQDIGPRREVHARWPAVRVLEVDGDRPPPAVEDEMAVAVGAAAADRSGRSTRTISAPRSASSMPANGPGPMHAISTTRTPAQRPGRPGLGRLRSTPGPDRGALLRRTPSPPRPRRRWRRPRPWPRRSAATGRRRSRPGPSPSPRWRPGAAPFGVLDRQRRVGGDPAGQCEGPGDDLVRRRDVVDQAPLAAVAASTGSPVRASWAASLIGICRCSRITPPAAANRPRFTSGRPKAASSEATTRSQAERDLGAAAHRVAVDGGDEGLADPVLGEAGEPPLRVDGRGDGPAGRDLLEVGAGAEGAARAGDDDRPAPRRPPPRAPGGRRVRRRGPS